MRLAGGLLLVMVCGFLLLGEAFFAVAMLFGRAGFGGGGKWIEYASFAVLVVFSAFGLYAGIRALSDTRVAPPAPAAPDPRTDAGLPGRIVAWALTAAGLLCIYELLASVPLESRGPAPGVTRLLGIGGVVSLIAGAVLGYVYRRRSAG